MRASVAAAAGKTTPARNGNRTSILRDGIDVCLVMAPAPPCRFRESMSPRHIESIHRDVSAAGQEPGNRDTYARDRDHEGVRDIGRETRGGEHNFRGEAAGCRRAEGVHHGWYAAVDRHRGDPADVAFDADPAHRRTREGEGRP